MIKFYIQPKVNRIPCETVIAHHRLLIDYQELFDEKTRKSSKRCHTCFDEPIYEKNVYIMNFGVVPNQGFYKDIPFNLKILIPKDYPFFPPRIFCLSKTVHPNINMDTGEVCIAMLEEQEWIPVMNLNFILFALELIVIQPNLECIPDNSKNHELAKIFQSDLGLFEKLIEESQFTSELDIEDQKIQFIEKQMTTMKMNEDKMGNKVFMKSNCLDIETQEKRKEEIVFELEQKLINFESSKKRYREEEGLINPFLKQVRITSDC